MANKCFRKSQLIAFDNVAAGHDGVLSDPSGTLIVKPCKQSEIDFYESTSSHPTILPFISTYMGRISLGTETAQAAGALILPGETTPDGIAEKNTATIPVVAHAWAPSNGGKIETDHAVVLENIAAGYKQPNILDVKLGARLWADDAPVEKRVRLDSAAQESTSKPLGFRIAGMKTYQGPKATGEADITVRGYKVFDKNYGRSFNAGTVYQGFREYFRLDEDVRPTGAIKKVIKRFVGDLQAMRAAIEKEETRMYSASLLFVYEGDFEALDDALIREAEVVTAYHDKQRISDHTVSASAGTSSTRDDVNGVSDGVDGDGNSDDGRPPFPSVQNLKLIDFAHAQWTPGQGPDENLLHGIRNVIHTLIGLLS
ncbi:MAG: hypothetical protein Q9163_002821 [Psora crenata]